MYSYRHLVLPRAKNWDFMPSNRMLVQVLNLVTTQGWVESEGTIRVRETNPLSEEPAVFSETDRAGLERRVMNRPERHGFRASFPPRPDEWWEAEKRWVGVEPQHASSLELSVPRLLAVLPSLEGPDEDGEEVGLFVPCPACGDGLTLPVGEAWTAQASEDFWEGFGLPRACSRCQAPTYPGKLSACVGNSGRKGRPKIRAPFYRFALDIGLSLRVPPRKLPPTTPRALLEDLREICGVSFRAHGRVA